MKRIHTRRRGTNASTGSKLRGARGRVVASAAAVALTVPLIAAKCAPPPSGVTFSLDADSESVGMLGAWGDPIHHGSILTVSPPGAPGPNPPLVMAGIPVPGTVLRSTDLGHMPPGPFELDALSYGRDAGEGVYFSVDEYAQSIPGTPSDLVAEGAAGAQEAAADIFRYLGLKAIIGPGPTIGNQRSVDGAGDVALALRGIGLIEPNAPFTPGWGDDIDAMDTRTRSLDLLGDVYFSLDPQSATANGVSPADILVSPAAGGLNVAVQAQLLGLDPQGDDVDALAMRLNSDGDITDLDEIYFSVTPSSQIVGQADSRFGAPIEPGDVLEPPAQAGWPPAIFIAAERMGLETVRHAGVQRGDNLNALDMRPPPSSSDPDGDNIPNGIDVCPQLASPSQTDSDGNGRGDECECGDADGDGKVTTSDAEAILDFEAGQGDAGILCDADFSGDCTAADAEAILDYLSAEPGSGLSLVCAQHH